MFKFSAVSQIWKKYIQKLNDWDLSLKQKKKIAQGRGILSCYNRCQYIYRVAVYVMSPDQL